MKTLIALIGLIAVTGCTHIDTGCDNAWMVGQRDEIIGITDDCQLLTVDSWARIRPYVQEH